MSTPSSVPSPDPRAVFVVHGRNLKARDHLWTFLKTIGLRPISWEKAVESTREPVPFIGDVLEAGFDEAQAVVVLLTGDDVARVERRYGREALSPQPRENVLFEAGMALGRFPKRTLFVQVGELRGFTDMAGRHVVRLDGNPHAAQDIVQRLTAAGCIMDATDRESAAVALDSQSMIETDPHRTLEIGKRPLCAGVAALAVLIFALGFLGRVLVQNYNQTVAVSGYINSRDPVTLYFVVANETRSTPGKLEHEIVPMRDAYRVLYVEGSSIRNEEDVKLVRGALNLPTYPRVRKEVASDADAENFLHGKP